VLGNALALVQDPRAFYDEMSEYGDVVSYSIPRLDFCTVLHPDLVERVLLTDHERFGKYGFEELGGEFASEGLLLTEGEQWRRQRTTIQNAFTMDRIRGYGDAMADYTRRMVDDWDDGEAISINREFSRLTLQVLAHSLFDIDLGPEADLVREFAETVNDRGSLDGVSAFLPMWVPTPENRRYKRVLAEFRSFVEDLIDERRGRVDEYDDILSLLLTAEDEDGNTMSEVELRDQMATFLFAGHETTSLALTFTMLEVAQRDDVRERLDAEYADVLDGSSPAPEQAPSLGYTDRVIQESLRLYPPAFIIFRGPRGRRTRRLPRARGDEGHPPAVPRPHGRAVVRRPDAVRPGPLDRRVRGGAAGLRLLPVRRRPASLYRHAIRHARTEDGAADAAPAGRVRPPVGPGPGNGYGGHDAARR